LLNDVVAKSSALSQAKKPSAVNARSKKQRLADEPPWGCNMLQRLKQETGGGAFKCSSHVLIFGSRKRAKIEQVYTKMHRKKHTDASSGSLNIIFAYTQV
jgi:hypothetical protein